MIDTLTALNASYRERAELVAALSKCFPASLEYDPEEPAWPVCIIELPTGQCSWHVSPDDVGLFAHLPHPGGREWDGHDTPTKRARLNALGAEVAGMPTVGETEALGGQRWVAADDVLRLARELDVAMNGEKGAALAPRLSDVVPQAIRMIEESLGMLSTLTTAADDLLTGISIHNASRPDSEQRPQDIRGPVVSALTNAAHKARLYLGSIRKVD